jgi:WhiB family redox-sensing transcriptional regulator
VNGEWTVIPDAYGTVRTLRGPEAAHAASHVPATDEQIAEAFATDPRGTVPDQPACKGEDPELWFPEKGGSPVEAKQICGTCPDRVRDACLLFALEHHIPYGVFGGLTEEERRPLLRLRSIPRPVPERCGNDLHDRTEANTSRQRGANGGFRCKLCDRAAHAARRQAARAEREAA